MFMGFFRCITGCFAFHKVSQNFTEFQRAGRRKYAVKTGRAPGSFGIQKGPEDVLGDLQMFVSEMGIDAERGSNVRVTHQLLGGFFVHTGFIKQRSIGMPELMQCAADPRFSLEFLPAVPADIVRYWLPPGQRENNGRAISGRMSAGVSVLCFGDSRNLCRSAGSPAVTGKPEQASHK